VTLSVVKVVDLKKVSFLVRARSTIMIRRSAIHRHHKRPVDGRPSFAEHRQALFFCTGEFATMSPPLGKSEVWWSAAEIRSVSDA
jgi:hypothetical protein